MNAPAFRDYDDSGCAWLITSVGYLEDDDLAHYAAVRCPQCSTIARAEIERREKLS